MIQWIIVAIIIALCLLYIVNRLRKHRKGGPCCNCSDPNCPRRRQ